MEIIVSAQAPAITDNFDVLRVSIQDKLKKYEIDVTEENLAEAKKQATELNSLAKTIDEKRKATEKIINAPVVEFKDKCNELKTMVLESRTKILDQVKVFEDLRVAKCLELLKEELQGHHEGLGVREEFRASDVSGLAMISNITKSDSLTKSARDSVAGLAAKDHAAQSNHDMMTGMIKSAESRLDSQIPDHMKRSLMNSKTFSQDLESYVTQELSRREKVRIQEEARAKAKAEAEARSKIEAEAKAKADQERFEKEKEAALEKARILAEEEGKLREAEEKAAELPKDPEPQTTTTPASKTETVYSILIEIEFRHNRDGMNEKIRERIASLIGSIPNIGDLKSVEVKS